MEIKFKSNRKFLLNITIPFIVIFSFGLIAVIIGWIFSPAEFHEILPLLLLVSIFDIVEIFVFIFAKYYNGKSYLFTKESIKVYDKGVFVKEVKVNEIKSMHYYPWRTHYIITIFFGALNEGGAWKIHILEKGGIRHEIGFLSEKDAILLQEEFYSDMLEIRYDKRKHTKAV